MLTVKCLYSTPLLYSWWTPWPNHRQKSIAKYHILDMFPIHFGLGTSHKVPLCTECKSYGDHSQCTNCSTPHDSTHAQQLNNLVPMEVNTVGWHNILAKPYYRPLINRISHHRHPTLTLCCLIASQKLYYRVFTKLENQRTLPMMRSTYLTTN